MDNKKGVSSYTRAHAIDDGALVDVSAFAKDISFRYPVAMSRNAWNRCVLTHGHACRREIDHKLRDVLKTLRMEILGNPNCSSINFTVKIRTEVGSSRNLNLKAICSPGDRAEPVITILMAKKN